MSNSRTKNAVRNSSLVLLFQIIYVITGFIGRTILTTILGAEYVGVNGLFANILTILSFAELGLGSSLIYRLYAPLAEKDTAKITAFIRLYRNIYRIIIAIISVCGVAVIPLLKYIVEAPDIKEDLIVLYLLYLADTVVTYSFVYKKAILTADQKQYIISFFTQVFNIVMNIVQCVILLITHNFILYLIVKIISDLINNIACSAYAQKHYPYISGNTEYKISDDEISGLKSDAKGMLLTKIASTAFSGTDNIFISIVYGIKSVGILANYTLIMSIINSIMNSIFESITATIGDLNTTGDMEKTEKVLYRLFFINSSIYSLICIVMTLLIREFVTDIWLSDEYYLSTAVIIAAFVELFMRSLHFPLYTVRNSLGLFSQYKMWFVIAAVVNIVLDAALIIPLGITGLFISTIICRGSIYMVDIKAVYKFGFHKSSSGYYRQVVIWIAFTLIVGIISFFAVAFIPLTGIAGLILKALIITAVYAAAYIPTFGRTEYFRYFTDLLKKIVKRREEL